MLNEAVGWYKLDKMKQTEREEAIRLAQFWHGRNRLNITGFLIVNVFQETLSYFVD